MSHSKYEKPRAGSLGFLPRKRTKHHRGRIRRFPKDDPKKEVHLTAFIGYKAGMTHILREVEKQGSRLHKKEVVEAVTIVDCPKSVIVGIVGYIETPRGLKKIATVFAEHLDESCIRRFYKHYRGKDKFRAFKKYQKADNWKNMMQKKIPFLKKRAAVIRVLVHPKMRDLNLGIFKAPLIEVQVNGGNVEQKVQWAVDHLEKEVRVSDVFKQGDYIDVIGVTKGRGFMGVTERFGVRKLPRKTHKGLRKVGCIGSWHPERVRWTVARAGQLGHHHRTDMNKRIYRIGQSARENKDNAMTEADLTQKSITPLGGFPHYGVVNNDYVMLKGCCVGKRKRNLILRKAIFAPASHKAYGPVNLKFIDTSSKYGHGRFQTAEEKRKFFVRRKTEGDTKLRNKDIDRTRNVRETQPTKTKQASK
jgi:large subunit ribosomal protein L3e